MKNAYNTSAYGSFAYVYDIFMDNIYFDEETGKLMQSVTVQGGDVEQIPYEEDSDGD